MRVFDFSNSDEAREKLQRLAGELEAYSNFRLNPNSARMLALGSITLSALIAYDATGGPSTRSQAHKLVNMLTTFVGEILMEGLQAQGLCEDASKRLTAYGLEQCIEDYKRLIGEVFDRKKRRFDG